jgi:hypothetical protein
LIRFKQLENRGVAQKLSTVGLELVKCSSPAFFFGQALSQLVLCGKQDRSNAEDALLIPISQISVNGLGLNSKSGIFSINRLRSRFA